MKVLSLFDGMSCGRIALDQLGIPVEKYYASEIDKYAIKVTQANYPNTVQVGDICNLDPKDYKDVDLMLAGSPCQGFSFAGKQLAFDDPRSALFFEFIRLLKAIKPKYFLLENVRMKKEFLEVITEQLSQCYEPADVDNQFLNVLGEVRFEPIFINSSLVSAQSRQRYYWTNIPGIKQPEDRGIVLRDILETEPNNFTKMSDKFVKRNGDRNCMIDQNKEKASNLSAMEYVKNGRQGNYLACDDNGKPVHKPIKLAGEKGNHYGGGLFDTKGKSPTLNGIGNGGGGTNNIPKVLSDSPKITTPKQVGKIKDGGQGNRIYSQDGKSSTLSAQSGGTAGNGNTLVETKPKKAYDIPREILKDNERQRRVYDPSGKSPTVLARSDSPKITTPKQVGVAVDINGHDVLKRVYSPDGKSPTINTCQGGNREPKVVTGGAFRGRAYDKDGKRKDRDGSSVAKQTKQMLELRKDNKSNAITTVGKDSVVVEESKIRSKSKTVRSGGRGSYDRHEWDSVDELHWRKLTCLECERLQTVPDNYTNHVSNTQRYKMLGNGWTVEVIKHILQNMEYENDTKS
ncbi:MAG: DNA (cytosine-5-)-methyltransferase [Pseudomonadota bacterium]|nr:DNA (cytosine-5-)-methyltransferase [Pseudomonadota bacterium]